MQVISDQSSLILFAPRVAFVEHCHDWFVQIGSATKSMNGSQKPLLKTLSDPLGISSVKLHQREIKHTDMLDRFSCWREMFDKHHFFPEAMGLVARRRETILMNESIKICLKLNPCESSLVLGLCLT